MLFLFSLMQNFRSVYLLLWLLLGPVLAFGQAPKTMIPSVSLDNFEKGQFTFITCSNDIPGPVIHKLDSVYQPHGFTLNICKFYKSTKKLIKRTPEFVIIEGWKAEDKKRGIFICEAPRYTDFFIFYFDMDRKMVFYTPTSNPIFLEFNLSRILREMRKTEFFRLNL